MIQLDWDSDFFGFPVFKLRLGADNVHLLDGIECGNEGVCYVLATPEASRLSKCRLEALGAVKYGVRKEFERNLSEDNRQIDARISCLSQLRYFAPAADVLRAPGRNCRHQRIRRHSKAEK